jgi:hypothetical protein
MGYLYLSVIFSISPSSFINNKENGYLQIIINNTDWIVLRTDFSGSDGNLTV